MTLKKCPRCELNYIMDEGALCVICREEVHGRRYDEEDLPPAGMCSVCEARPALPGKGMCKACLKEYSELDIQGGGEEDEGVDAKEIGRSQGSEMDGLEEDGSLRADEDAGNDPLAIDADEADLLDDEADATYEDTYAEAL